MNLAMVLRILRRRSGYFGWLGATVALSTTAAAALFAIADGLLLRPLPFPDADRLVVLDFRQANGRLAPLAYQPDLLAERALLQSRLIESSLIDGFALNEFTQFFDPTSAQEGGVRAEGVGETFFSLFGFQTVLGRTFTAEERATVATGSEGPLPVVVSHSLWHRLYGGRPDVLGTHDLAGRHVRIVGVLEPGAKFPGETNVWAPTPGARTAPPRFVRLAQDVTIQQLEAAFPEVSAVTLASFVRPASAGAIPILLGASVLLMLTVLLQLMTLELAETPERMRTAGIQAALGAGTRDLLASRALPIALVIGVASAVGWIAAGPLAYGISRLLPPELVNGQYIQPDARSAIVVLGLFGFFLAALAIAPAIFGRAAPPAELLGSRIGVRHMNTAGLRRSLMALQVAASGLLLYLLGLTAHSYYKAVTFDFGFSPGDVYVFTPPRPTRPERPAGQSTRAQVQDDWAQQAEFKARIQNAVDLLTDSAHVAAAASVFAGPLDIGNGGSRRRQLAPITVVGEPVNAEEITAAGNSVGVDFVDAIGATVVSGLPLSAPALDDRDNIALVNETLARRLAQDISVGTETIRRGVVGRRIWTVNGTLEIVGVVRDLLDSRLNVPNVPQYFHLDQHSSAAAAMVIRITPGSAVDPILFLRTTVEPIWGSVAPQHFGRLDDALQPVIQPYQGQAMLLALLLVFCFPITCAGLAGAMTVVVRQRAKEFAIRAVLGADGRALRALILQDAIPPMILGLAAAVVAGLLVARGSSHVLFGVADLDPVSVTVAVAGLASVTSLAMLSPIREVAKTTSRQWLQEP